MRTLFVVLIGAAIAAFGTYYFINNVKRALCPVNQVLVLNDNKGYDCIPLPRSDPRYREFWR